MMTRRIPARAPLCALCALSLLGTVSCTSPSGGSSSPGAVDSLGTPSDGAGDEKKRLAPVRNLVSPVRSESTPTLSSVESARQVQSQVMDFADELTMHLSESTDALESRTQSVRSRIVAHRLKYSVGHGATIIAAAQNPRIALVDMYVMISLQRSLNTTNIIPQYFGGDAPELVKVFDHAHEQIGALLSKMLTDDQRAEVDRLVNKWLTDNPDRLYAGYVRFSEFSGARQLVSTEQSKGRSASVFGFLFSDPFAGLDPATREITQTRLFAERAFFYLQRMPVLLSWQTEMLLMDSLSEPEMRSVLTSIQTLSSSSAQLTEDVHAFNEGLPEMLSTEREAILSRLDTTLDEQRQKAIDQALAGLSAEREALLDQIARENEELTPVLTELRQTLDSATELSESVRTTTAQFDELAKTLHLDEQREEGEEGSATSIKDVTAALQETTKTAQELIRLSESLRDTTAPEVLNERLDAIEGRLANAEGGANRLIDRAFRLGLVLVGLLAAGMIVAAWLVRGSKRG